MKLSSIITIGAVSGLALVQGVVGEIDAACSLCIAGPFSALLSTDSKETTCPAFDNVNEKLLSCPCTPEDVSSMVNSYVSDLSLSMPEGDMPFEANSTTIFQVVSYMVLQCETRLYAGNAAIDSICEEACYTPLVEPVLELINGEMLPSNCSDVEMYAQALAPCSGVCPTDTLIDDEGNGPVFIAEGLTQLATECSAEVQASVNMLTSVAARADNMITTEAPTPKATPAPTPESAAVVDQLSTGLVAAALVVTAALFR